MISRRLFDTTGGRDVYLYTLESDEIAVEICDLGAAIRSLRIKTLTPSVDVCLGFDSVRDYLDSNSYCGATVGRVANRVAGGRFSLNGREYALGLNEGANCNHSGLDGFDRRLFRAEISGDTLSLYLDSVDGDQGFPGLLNLRVDFEVDRNVLKIVYAARADSDTFFAPTCHAYFNLAGEGSGDATDTLLTINAESYTPLTADHIPTGELRSVAGTPFDFREAKPISADIAAEDGQLKDAGGYDHNFAIVGRPSAVARSPKTGITMTLDTDFPGLQFYTANFLKGSRGKTAMYDARCAFCLEPQYFPNAVNIPSFLSPLIKAGETRTNFIRYEFQHT